MEKALSAERYPSWKRSCPELDDIDFVRLVLLRSISAVDSGRHFLQITQEVHGELCPHSTYFKSLQSPRRASMLEALDKQSYKLHCERMTLQGIEALVSQASSCDKEEDQAYKDKISYELEDDLKFKQNRLEKIQKAKEALEKREEELNPGKPVEDKKQISFADMDARIMGKKGSGYGYGYGYGYDYNPQISVDEDNQIIIGQHVSQNATDKKELKPALEAIKNTTGQLPDKLSMDNGYLSGDNLEVIQSSGLDAYVATNQGGKEKQSLFRRM